MPPEVTREHRKGVGGWGAGGLDLVQIPAWLCEPEAPRAAERSHWCSQIILFRLSGIKARRQMRHTAEQIPSHSEVNKGKKHTPEPSNHISVPSEILYLNDLDPTDTNDFQADAVFGWFKTHAVTFDTWKCQWQCINSVSVSRCQLKVCSGPSLGVRSCKHTKQISSLEIMADEDTFTRGVGFCSFVVATFGSFGLGSLSLRRPHWCFYCCGQSDEGHNQGS